MGQQQPDGGELRIGDTVVPMYVDQSREALDPERSVYEEICGGADEVDLSGRRVPARAYCGWYNFKSADQQKKVGMLSGGWLSGVVCGGVVWWCVVCGGVVVWWVVGGRGSVRCGWLSGWLSGGFSGGWLVWAGMWWVVGGGLSGGLVCGGWPVWAEWWVVGAAACCLQTCWPQCPSREATLPCTSCLFSLGPAAAAGGGGCAVTVL